MTDSKLGTITPGRYRTRGGGISKVTRRIPYADLGYPFQGFSEDGREVAWTIYGRYYRHLGEDENDLIERIGDLEPEPLVMREGRCRLRDEREGVARKHHDCGWWVSILGESGEHRVHDDGLCSTGSEFFVDVVAMLDDEPKTLKVYICQKCGNRHDGQDVYWTADYSHPLCSNCRPPEPLVIEAGSMLMTEYGEMKVDTLIAGSAGDGMSGVMLYCSPHTPAPKAPRVYRMADESLLPGWAIGYFYSSALKQWVWFSVQPQRWENKWSTFGMRLEQWGYIPSERAPQDLPDDFDWRESLVMVDRKGE